MEGVCLPCLAFIGTGHGCMGTQCGCVVCASKTIHCLTVSVFNLFQHFSRIDTFEVHDLLTCQIHVTCKTAIFHCAIEVIWLIYMTTLCEWNWCSKTKFYHIYQVLIFTSFPNGMSYYDEETSSTCLSYAHAIFPDNVRTVTPLRVRTWFRKVAPWVAGHDQDFKNESWDVLDWSLKNYVTGVH